MNYGIGNVKDKSKSLFTTTTAPTESGDVITLATSDIIESGFKVGDYLAYVDSGNISALYSISAISSGTATLSLVGNFGGGGGKQLYLHNVRLQNTNNRAFVVNTTIINDNNTQFDYQTLRSYLEDKGFLYNSDNDTFTSYNAGGNWNYGTTYYNIYGICTASGGSNILWGGASDSNHILTNLPKTALQVLDTILPL